MNGKFRVRIVVPDELQAHLPPPHTGKRNLTKSLGTGNEREANRVAVPYIAEFQGIIAQTESRIRGFSELSEIDRLSYPELIRRAPAVLERFLRTLDLPEPVAEIREPVSFESMIALWGRGKSKQAIDNMTAKCRRFAEYLGHDNMARVTFADCRGWKDEMIDDGDLSSGTISNHLKLTKALFKYAFDNDRISVNHMGRVKYSPGHGEERDDFTAEERRRILAMARDAEPHVYWCNWLCSFHGTRTGEVADMSTLDIEIIDEIAIFDIHRKNRNKDQRLKTLNSARRLALHQAVLDEGFIEFRDEVVRKHGHGALFREIRLDHYGRRAGTVTKDLCDWLRNTADPRKPFYSHRHVATSYLRNTLGPDGSPVVKEDIERYILGHGKKGSHAGYGKVWFETLKAAVEVIPNPLQAD